MSLAAAMSLKVRTQCYARGSCPDRNQCYQQDQQMLVWVLLSAVGIFKEATFDLICSNLSNLSEKD